MIKEDPTRNELWGEDIRRAMAYYGVSPGRLSRQTDTNKKTIQSYMKLNPSSGNVPPRWLEWVFLAYDLYPELVDTEERLPLDYTDLGLDSDFEDLTWGQLGQALTHLGVDPSRFGMHAGRKTVFSIGRKIREEALKPIPLWAEWILLIYVRHPETRGMEHRFELPLEKWREEPTLEGLERETLAHPVDD